MIAYEKWKVLTEWVEQAVVEGRASGFDKEEDTFHAGCYHAYYRVWQEMQRLNGGEERFYE